jgi:hypothetical protein
LRVISMQSTLPIYHTCLDWDAFFAEYPVPDVLERTVLPVAAGETARVPEQARESAGDRHSEMKLPYIQNESPGAAGAYWTHNYSTPTQRNAYIVQLTRPPIRIHCDCPQVALLGTVTRAPNEMKRPSALPQ